VVGNSVISCGKCFSCLRGDRHLCANRKVLGMDRPGAMAEFVVMPVDHIYPMPQTLDPVTAVLTEPLVNGIHIVNMMPPVKNPSVVIIGAGTIGLLVLQAVVVLRGGRVLMVDLNEARLEIARELGAEKVINPVYRDLIKESREFSGADGVDFCIDAIGTDQTKVQCIDVLRPGGTGYWIGLHDNEINLSSYNITLYEKKVSGTYTGKKEEFELAIELLASGKIKGGRWIKVFSMDEAASAFKRMLVPQKDEVKAVIIPEERNKVQ